MGWIAGLSKQYEVLCISVQSTKLKALLMSLVNITSVSTMSAPLLSLVNIQHNVSSIAVSCKNI